VTSPRYFFVFFVDYFEAHRPSFPNDECKRRERENLLPAPTQAGGRIYGPGGAAELLRVKPSTLTYRLKAMGVQKPSKRTTL